MPDSVAILVAFTLISVATAAWAYLRARKLHLRIEASFPGFNALMREYGKRRHRG